MANFSAAGSAMSFPQSGTFRDAASMNQQMHNNIQAAHANRIAQANVAEQQQQAGYSNLSNAVLRRLAGSNRANIQDINDKYTAMMGSVQAQLIARGLGNTSVLGDLARGVTSDRMQEITRSRGLFNQLKAGYQSQIGLAGLGAMGQGIGLMSGLQGDQISSLERESAPYPSGGEGGRMLGMPGPSPGFAPTGGMQPSGLFAPSYGLDFSGGGGGGSGIFGLAQGGGGSPGYFGGEGFDFAGAGGAINNGMMNSTGYGAAYNAGAGAGQYLGGLFGGGFSAPAGYGE